jgi:hypothetical protein
MGYQGSPQDVIHKVFAVWNVMQRQGLRYSSITTPSGESRSVMSQHVRFLDEAVQNSQANCADGTVLFASILYKLGIYPVLVKVPGRMFLGFYTDSQRQQVSFLETTMLGEPGLNSIQREWTFKTVDGYLSSESYRQFVNALNEGQAKFQQAAPQFEAKNPAYLLIDIQAARRAGTCLSNLRLVAGTIQTLPYFGRHGFGSALFMRRAYRISHRYHKATSLLLYLSAATAPMLG